MCREEASLQATRTHMKPHVAELAGWPLHKPFQKPSQLRGKAPSPTQAACVNHYIIGHMWVLGNGRDPDSHSSQTAFCEVRVLLRMKKQAASRG